ncbi:MAG: hypothetical protein ACREMN_13160, partial [Gemmatimonadales bacterium]
PGGLMPRLMLLSLALFLGSRALAGQQPAAATHDSVRGAISAVDVQTRTLEVTAGVGFALRVVRLEVPPSVPITDREDTASEPIGLPELRRGDVIRAVFGSGSAGPGAFVAYAIERVGRMETGVPSPTP